VVVVFADADSVGRKHATRVALSCATWSPPIGEACDNDPYPTVRLELGDPDAAPLKVKVIDPPGLMPGEDVFDWITVHGNRPEDLRRLVEEAAEWSKPDPVAIRRAQGRERSRNFSARKRAKHQLALALMLQGTPNGCSEDDEDRQMRLVADGTVMRGISDL
jgi:hypothetical protein